MGIYRIISLGIMMTLLFAAQTGLTKDVTGKETLENLIRGNARFAEGKSEHHRQDMATREQLSTGQKPPTIILSCSDSRVPPEIVFDLGLGEIFTVRTAGHLPTTESIASIEYAIEHLGAKLLIVMGHESCGAVKAAVTTPAGVSTHSPHLDNLISQIKKNIEVRNLKLMPDDPQLQRPVKDHVSATALSLIKNSALIRENVQKEKVVLAEAIYSLKTGKVEFWGVGHRFQYVHGEKPLSHH